MWYELDVNVKTKLARFDAKVTSLGEAIILSRTSIVSL